MIEVRELAEQLAVSPEDIEVLLFQLGHEPTTEALPVLMADEVRQLLDPHCERTMPELYTS